MEKSWTSRCSGGKGIRLGIATTSSGTFPIPVLGPDLIDLRTVEIAAERTAQGLLDTFQAGLPKPRQDPRASTGTGGSRR